MNYLIELVIPTYEQKEQILAFKKEHFDLGETTFNGSGGLDRYDEIEDWYAHIYEEMNRLEVTEQYVPGATYLAIRKEDGRIVGMVNIRYALNNRLLHFAGHVGYMVRRSERRKGYATIILHLALEILKEKGVTKALVTCDKENIGSAKTILHNGGILENEILYEGEIVQRYWINIFIN